MVRCYGGGGSYGGGGAVAVAVVAAADAVAHAAAAKLSQLRKRLRQWLRWWRWRCRRWRRCWLWSSDRLSSGLRPEHGHRASSDDDLPTTIVTGSLHLHDDQLHHARLILAWFRAKMSYRNSFANGQRDQVSHRATITYRSGSEMPSRSNVLVTTPSPSTAPKRRLAKFRFTKTRMETRTREIPVTTMTTETKTRMVPVTKTRMEDRTRTVAYT